VRIEEQHRVRTLHAGRCEQGEIGDHLPGDAQTAATPLAVCGVGQRDGRDLRA
jgi:hypothetical protein